MSPTDTHNHKTYTDVEKLNTCEEEKETLIALDIATHTRLTQRPRATYINKETSYNRRDTPTQTDELAYAQT